MTLVGACLLLTQRLGAQTAQLDAIIKAGPGALKMLLPVLDSPAMKQRHGFAPDDDMKAVTLDQPFEPCILTEAAMQKYIAGAEVQKSLAPGGKWYFPVISKGHTACWLSVFRRADGSWMADSLGMADWARVWADVCQDWPATNGFTPILVIVPSRQQFFFTVPQAKPPNLTLLVDRKSVV